MYKLYIKSTQYTQKYILREFTILCLAGFVQSSRTNMDSSARRASPFHTCCGGGITWLHARGLKLCSYILHFTKWQKRWLRYELKEREDAEREAICWHGVRRRVGSVADKAGELKRESAKSLESYSIPPTYTIIQNKKPKRRACQRKIIRFSNLR